MDGRVRAAGSDGVTIDRHLQWKEHVESAAAKGMATVLAISRLSRPTVGMPRSMIRQLYRSVAIPRIEYGLVAWYEPIRHQEGSSRRKGSVGVAAKLAKVQRLATTIITGALRTTATTVLDYHAQLPPIHLQLNKTVHDATVRLACLPASHPLHDTFRRCRRIPASHLSTIHKLRKAFPHIDNLETIDPAFSDPSWILPAKIDIANNREEAIENIIASYPDHTLVFSDGSGYNDQVGAAAIAVDENGHEFERRKYLGPLSRHTVYEAEVAGIALAVDIIIEMQVTGKIAILLDNQAAITSMTKRKPHSGQALVKMAQESICNLINRHHEIELTIVWVPGHEGVEGNEKADRAAKEAAEGLSTDTYSPIPDLDDEPPASAAALKVNFKKAIPDLWKAEWKECKQFERIKKFDARPPSSFIQKFYNGRNRADTSLITQFRANHVALPFYLHRIKAIDTPNCPRCNVPDTVNHFLTKCLRHVDERIILRMKIGRRPMSLPTLLGIPKIMTHTLEFIHSTNRLPHYAKKTHPQAE